jgi:hypothetical protein
LASDTVFDIPVSFLCFVLINQFSADRFVAILGYPRLDFRVCAITVLDAPDALTLITWLVVVVSIVFIISSPFICR